jgi:dTDP-4-amino-4,6-dideoxygalactose transaminase
MIPLLDLGAQYQTIKLEIDAAIQDVLSNGKFILGPHEHAFEEEVAAYLGVRHAIGVASGTDALVIALRTAGVGPGDEVIVPAYSFFATAGTVLTVGARPVFVDVDPRTYLMDVTQLEGAATSRTRAIIPVHLYGQAADMDEIRAFAERRSLKVIEDNAQAFGASYHGQKTGAIGDLGCLSFFPSKNLGAYGDAGMVTTNDDALAEKVRMLRTHGWKKKYFPEILGYNSRLDEIQAAILQVKLKCLDGWNARRAALAQVYNTRLGTLGMQTPVIAPGRTHVYHLYIIRAPGRPAFQQRLKDLGVASEVYYPQPLHLSAPCRALGWREGLLPVSEGASLETLALPLYPELTNDQVEAIFQAVATAWQEINA